MLIPLGIHVLSLSTGAGGPRSSSARHESGPLSTPAVRMCPPDVSHPSIVEVTTSYDDALTRLRSITLGATGRTDVLTVIAALEASLSTDPGKWDDLIRAYDTLTDPLQRAAVVLSLRVCESPRLDQWFHERAAENDAVGFCAVLAMTHVNPADPIRVEPGCEVDGRELVLLGALSPMLDSGFRLSHREYRALCKGSILAPCDSDLSAPSSVSLTDRGAIDTVYRLLGCSITEAGGASLVVEIEDGGRWAVRQFALRLLESTKRSAQHLSVYRRMLESEKEEDRQIAFQALGGSASHEAVEELLSRIPLTRGNGADRKAALHSLGIAPYESSPIAATALDQELRAEREPAIRRTIVHLLSRIESPTATTALTNVLLLDSDEAVRLAALDALARTPGIRDPATHALFTRLLEQDPESAIGSAAGRALSLER